MNSHHPRTTHPMVDINGIFNSTGGEQMRLVTCHQSSRDLKEMVELIQPSHLNCSIPPLLQTFSIHCATLLPVKQASECRTMLGCIFLCHRLMTRDQPPLGGELVITMCVIIRSRSHGNSSQYRAIKTTTDYIGATKISKCGAH